MTTSKPTPKATSPRRDTQRAKPLKKRAKELVIVTGISGAGKASALKAFEDLGFHAVDNLPLELLPDFAGLVSKSAEVERAAIVVDVREGATLDRLPEILKSVKTAAADARGVSGRAGRGAGSPLLGDAPAAPAGQGRRQSRAPLWKSGNCSIPFAMWPIR